MPPLARRPSRGLADLRTLTGRSDAQVPVHKAYLQISFLELERARHAQEMRTASQRLEMMRNRCREIEAETAEILASIGGTAPRARPQEGPRLSPASLRPKPAGFHFSY